MVSSDSGGPGAVDGGAGSIVWVRRRNGSWWPGKILGPDELSASHLMSPRSGTPVKLLGREDASVDWYNLEKSKRVKAFRCGEFDDCIERAEASLGLPAKKREKYARREDAILHALELEKQFLEKKYGKIATLSSIRENSSDSERKGLATSSGTFENGNGKPGSHNLYQLDKKVDVSNTMERNLPIHAQKAKDAIRPNSHEHNADVSRRIRGLQDIGLRVPVNRMIYASAASDYSTKMALDGHAYSISVNDPCFENSSDSDTKIPSGKRKRLLEGIVEESLPKRHNRHHAELPDCDLQPDGDFISMYEREQTEDGVHRSMYFPAESHIIFDTNHGPRGQMNTVSRLEVGNCNPQHGTFAEDTTCGSSEETESDSSETHSLEQHVEPGMLLSDAETRMRAQTRTLDRLEMQGGHESTSSDESDELLLDGRPRFFHHDPNLAGAGVSKWQLKGKRNVRSFSKRPMDRLANRMDLEGRGRSLSQRAPSHNMSYYHDNDYSNDVEFIEDDFESPTQGFGKRGYLPSRFAAKRQNFVGQNMIDWEDLTWGRPFTGYWEGRGGSFSPAFGRTGHDMLIDVDLKVQANRQGEHVPWVSLMSRLNGKAIIGHPIQIEALDDGSTDILVSTGDMYGNLKYDVDSNRVPPVWRTARRTANFRVPRPHLSSQLDGDEDADNQYVHHQSGKVRSKKSLASCSLSKGSLTKKAHSHVGRSPLQGMKKPSRKANPSSNQKTKTLSSIGFDQKFSNKRKENDTSYYMDGVIKCVDSAPPAVACIPVKLVFSRLLEAVGRPPSGPAKHGVSVNSNKERKPS